MWLRLGVLAAFGTCAAVAVAASEPGWAVYRDQVPALLYGDPEKALISIICGRDEKTDEDETWITIEVEPGVKPAPVNVVLVLENGTARKEVRSSRGRAHPINAQRARRERFTATRRSFRAWSRRSTSRRT